MRKTSLELDEGLLVVEPELARVLRVMGRQGNTLSAILRDAWDTGDLRSMTRKDPLAATGAHVALLGHITIEELRRELSDVEAANGFANRIPWFAVRRSKQIPEPEPLAGPAVEALAEEVARALRRASAIGLMTRDPDARELWRDVYGDLTAGRDGLAGAILARAEAHLLRFSLGYALLDGSPMVSVEHLAAAPPGATSTRARASAAPQAAATTKPATSSFRSIGGSTPSASARSSTS